MADSVNGLDPRTDAAMSPTRARIRTAYEKLQMRGEEARAEELREAAPINKQVRMLEDIVDFDPELDDADTTTKIRIRRVYRALYSHDRPDLAEELREIPSLAAQKERAHELKQRIEDGDLDEERPRMEA